MRKSLKIPSGLPHQVEFSPGKVWNTLADLWIWTWWESTPNHRSAANFNLSIVQSAWSGCWGAPQGHRHFLRTHG